ncbi:MAG: lactonase family protein [Bacteroidetes bacterium]|nr:lactonase family protein [Bacteroidota bacterium]
MRLLACILTVFSLITAQGQSYYLLVGTYTNRGSNNATPPADSTGSKGIYVFEWANGHATLKSITPAVNPSFLTISADGRYVYACTESRTQQEGSVSAYALDRASQSLKFINKVPSGSANPAYVSVHQAGRWVAVANYTGGSLSVYPTAASGALLPAVRQIQHTGHSVHSPNQDHAHVHSVLFSPEGRTLYVQDLGEDSINIHPFNSAEQQPMAGAGEAIATLPGTGPRHLTFHPSGKYAYLIEELGGSVDVFQLYPGTGKLKLLQRIAAHADTAKGPFRSADIHVTPDGRFLYASNRAEANLAMFEIDQSRGTLKTIGYQPVFGKEPRNFMIDPTGGYLLVANQDSNTIIVFKIDAQTGRLIPTKEKISVPSPVCLIMTH